MVHIILVEAALEIIPLGLIAHPSVRRNARRRGKRAEETLLNRSLHHAAMEKIPENHKRGRPDIVNICLLEALGSPLNKQGKLKTLIHTYGGYSIEISPKTRIPRDCNRFFSLMEQLFAEGAVPPGVEEPLMTLTQTTLENMLKKIKPTYVVALSSHGEQTELEELSDRLVSHERPMFLVGAFPHGPMKPETLSLADEVLSIYPEPLEAWVVTSRIIYEYEKAKIRIECKKS